MLAPFPATVAAMSEPMVSHDVVAFYLLSEEVSQHVKVVQSGQGADEVFAGYHWYQTLAGPTTAARPSASSELRRWCSSTGPTPRSDVVVPERLTVAGDPSLGVRSASGSRHRAVDTAVDRALLHRHRR